MGTPSNKKGKGFEGKWSRLEWFADQEPILSPAERAQIYDKLKNKGLLRLRKEEDDEHSTDA